MERQRKNKSAPKRGRAKSVLRVRDEGLSHPPPTDPSIRVSKRFRFQSNASTDVTLTAANFLQLLVCATGAAASARLFSSVRLLKIEAWANPALGGANSEIVINGTYDGPANQSADISMGVTPAHVVWHPALKSRSALWYSTGAGESDPMLDLYCPVDTIVDVTIEAILMNANTASATLGPAPTGAIQNAVYLCTLDGSGVGGHLVPVDWDPLP